MITEHLHVSDKIASGPRALPDTRSAFATTQAAWRFYKNEDTTLEVLVAPLFQEAHQAVHDSCKDHVLAIHDWSHISSSHKNKKDRVQLSHQHDVGYELQSSLFVSDNSPIGQ